MDGTGHFELGHGVAVRTLPGDRLLVTSSGLELSWQTPRGKVPGTAVAWRDSVYQVVAEHRDEREMRWTLEPWPGSEAIRAANRLDAEQVASWRIEASDLNRRSQRRWLSIPFEVMLGFVPGELQEQWHLEWGFRGIRATALSALLECMVGAAGTIHMAATLVGGTGFLPPGLAWIGPFAPVVWIEGMFRLHYGVAGGEPMGSLIGLPLALLRRRKTPPVSRRDPVSVQLTTDPEGVEVVSPVFRRDWEGGGDLLFRQNRYRLGGVNRVGNEWHYRFVAGDGEEQRPLRLAAPPETPVERPRRESDAGPGIPSIIIKTVFLCFAPADLQQRWGERLGMSSRWLTQLSGGAEVVGGLVNLGEDLRIDGLWVWLDLLILGDGLARLVLSAMRVGPVGSVFGWPFRSLFERWLTDTDPDPASC